MNKFLKYGYLILLIVFAIALNISGLSFFGLQLVSYTVLFSLVACIVIQKESSVTDQNIWFKIFRRFLLIGSPILISSFFYAADQLDKIIIYRELYMNIMLPLIILVGSILDNKKSYQFGNTLIIWAPITLIVVMFNYLNWSFWASGSIIFEPDFKTASMSNLVFTINFAVLYLSEIGTLVYKKLSSRKLTSVSSGLD